MDSGNLTNIELRTLTPLFFLKISRKSSLSELQIGKNRKWDEVPFSELQLSVQWFILCNRGQTHAIVKQKFSLPKNNSTRSRKIPRDREAQSLQAYAIANLLTRSRNIKRVAQLLPSFLFANTA